jgi:hypothetical protein
MGQQKAQQGLLWKKIRRKKLENRTGSKKKQYFSKGSLHPDLRERF